MGESILLVSGEGKCAFVEGSFLLHLNLFVGVHAARQICASACFSGWTSDHQPPLFVVSVSVALERT